MDFNYFTVFSGADKEMMHSAMIRYLLRQHPTLARQLFVYFDNPIGEVKLEVKKNKFRVDIEVWSENNTDTLIVENKFKSLPTLTQLEDYGRTFKKLKENPVCYLVCFDGEGVRSQKNNTITAAHLTWHVLTYREIMQGILTYLREKQSIAQEHRIFLSHYAYYLEECYTKYDAVVANYLEAFTVNGKPVQEISREAEQESRFWQRLVLARIGNKFANQCYEEGEKCSCDASFGGATTPVLHIIPHNWSPYSPFQDIINKPPIFCVQLQGDFIKLGLDLIPKNLSVLNAEKILSGLENLWSILPDGLDRTAKETVARRLRQRNRFITLCRCKFDKEVSLDGVYDQLRNFFKKMDSCINRTRGTSL